MAKGLDIKPAVEMDRFVTESTLYGRPIEMFRTHYDPMIGPTPKQAFMLKDMHAKAFVTDIGVHVVLDNGNEHVVPYANVESIRLVKTA